MAQEMPLELELSAFLDPAPKGHFMVVAKGCNRTPGYETRLEELIVINPPLWARLYNEAPDGIVNEVLTPFCCELAMELAPGQTSVTVVLPDDSQREVTISRCGDPCDQAT